MTYISEGITLTMTVKEPRRPKPIHAVGFWSAGRKALPTSQVDQPPQ